MNLKKILAVSLALVLMLQSTFVLAQAEGKKETGFTRIDKKYLTDLKADAYVYRHDQTGAKVVYLDNGARRKDFAVGFRTPPTNSKGANHVLEHSLLCGSDRYPTPNLMHYVRRNALAEEINAVTVDDCTYYYARTKNEEEYYNLMDVYLNGIFHPLLRKEENIFRQQGIRKESVDGMIKYNGVVYNELRLRSLESTENSVDFLAEKLYASLYGNTTPAFQSGGTVEDLKKLTYEEVMKVYQTYYVPSNCMIYLSGTQDIEKTLRVLDRFLKGAQQRHVDLSFPDTKRRPKSPYQEYQITAATKTVDIGFMSSGVKMKAVRERYARDIIFDLLCKRMQEINEKNYVSVGNTGGISNVALLVTEVPIEKKEEVIDAYRQILKEFQTEGFPQEALTKAIDDALSQRKDSALYATELQIFNGLTYEDDPFYEMNVSKDFQWLKENPDFFQVVLRNIFIDNPCSSVIVSGNGGKASAETSVMVDAAEAAQVKLATAQFAKWADTPDPPEVIDRIPSLSLEGFRTAPEIPQATVQAIGNSKFYYTFDPDQKKDMASLYFPLQASEEELVYVQLLSAYLNAQAQKAQLSDVSFDILAIGNAQDLSVITPQFQIGFSAEKDEIGAQLLKVLSFLEGEDLWSEKDFHVYLKSAAKDLLEHVYQDPYVISYEMMRSAQSMEDRFNSVTGGSLGQGALSYVRFLQQTEAAPERDQMLFERIKGLLVRLMTQYAPTVEYVGRGDGGNVRRIVEARFAKQPPAKALPVPKLPKGYRSAVTMTNLEDANHFMIAGYFGESNTAYSGKMAVLAQVLTSNVLLPAMRGKYGAYGANLTFDRSGMVSAVAGLDSLDQAIEVWQDMGDHLRTLSMTQKELDGIIISVVDAYDEAIRSDANFGAYLALSGRTVEEMRRTREEMLCTTVEDLKGYADLIDQMVAQKRIFAVMSRSAADHVTFPFACAIDANTFTVTHCRLQ